MRERTVASYVLRVTVVAGRWRIVLCDVLTGATWAFDGFDALRAQLEQMATDEGPS